MKPEATNRSALVQTDAKPKIASELSVDVDDLVSGKYSSDIRALLEERGVLAFRQLNLSDEQQLAFTKTLGTDSQEYKITNISMDPLDNPGAEYQKASMFWHIDGTMIDIPIFASIMTSRKLSETGGQTEFSNTYAAYDDLPESEKRELEHLQVVHMFETSQRYSKPEPSYEELTAWQKFPPNTLPLVWTHRTGRKSLVLGCTASHVEGMGLRESHALLTRLRDWATQPEYVYRHEWTLGDLVIWDNTGTMHRVIPYPMGSGRMMYRTQISGDEPWGN